MGNRATVIFTDGQSRFSPAVYAHWNGGPESVYAFLAELDRRKVGADQDYEASRFIQIVGEFIDGSMSLGIANGPASGAIEDLEKVATDHGDNGFYLVNRTGDTMTMRRVTLRYNGERGYREWTPEEIAAEATKVDASPYRAGIAEFFAELAELRAKQKVTA